MLVIGLFIYLVINITSSHQDSSFSWLLVSLGIGLLVSNPLVYIWYMGSEILIFNNYISINITSLNILFIVLAIIITLLCVLNMSISNYNTTIIIAFSLLGVLLLLLSSSFVTIVLSLEVQSFAGYLLVASFPIVSSLSFNKSEGSLLGGLMYFILGAVASSTIILSVGIIYNIFGLLDYSSLVLTIELGISVLSIGLLLSGLGLKLGAAPLHFWTPYVYSIINNNLIAYISFISKVGIIVILIYIFNIYNKFSNSLHLVVIVIASLSLIVGALGGLNLSVNGLNFTSLRKLLAYSSINHVGFILIIIMIKDNLLILLYITQYGLTLLGVLLIVSSSFTLSHKVSSSTIFHKVCSGSSSINSNGSSFITLLNNSTRHIKFINNWYLVVSFSIMLISFVGIPPLIGFYSKYYVLILSIDNLTCSLGLKLGIYTLVFIGVVCSIITAFYYLRIIFYYYINTYINNLTQYSILEKIYIVVSVISVLIVSFPFLFIL